MNKLKDIAPTVAVSVALLVVLGPLVLMFGLLLAEAWPFLLLVAVFGGGVCLLMPGANNVRTIQPNEHITGPHGTISRPDR